MKLQRSARIFSFLLFILALSCARVVVSPGLTFGSSEAKWVAKTLSKMTLKEKIGQMIVCPYYGSFTNRDSDVMKSLRSLIMEKKIGGLIFKEGEVYETARLTNALQHMAKIPLLITSDFERGVGQKIGRTTLFPPVMSLGAIDSEDLAYLIGKVTAIEARALGIHVTYAPVVDVNINPDNPIIDIRSFGESPEHVSRLAVAFIKGCQENGLIATAKHFPGHGDTDMDSHLVLPVVNGDRKRLEDVELYPFRRSIEAGVQAIMTAHLWFPALDPTPNLPATLSSRIVTDLLRKELGFKGLIVADALDMGGIMTIYSPEEAVLKAVQAGVDIILQPLDPDRVIKAIIQGVKSGQISEDRISASAKRILMAKAKLGLHKRRFVDVETLDEIVASKKHLDFAARVFENSLTLVKNEGQTLPLRGEKQKVAVFSLSSDSGDYFVGQTFMKEVKKRCPELFSFYAEPSTGQEFFQEAVERASGADVIVIALFSRVRGEKGSVDLELRQIQLVKEIAERTSPVVAVSFGSPYFLRHFPEVDAYICAYRYASEAQKAAAKALFGEIDIRGRLPVSIPDLYPLGHGLTLLKKEVEK